jgi:hypothetical protein
MNAEELTARFRSQGFDYLSTEECLQYLNDAYLLDICEEEDWPFLEAMIEGEAPLEITDLRAIEYVVDTTQEIELRPIDRRNLVADLNTNILTEGTPSWYYLSAGDKINPYPLAANKLLVHYWKVPAELSGTVTPLLPTRFHSLIVDGAVARAYENSDDYELHNAKVAAFQARLMKMKETLGVPGRDGPESYIEVSSSLDLSV